jgi:uncharacterized membrane protein YkvA (DUF1232 family)
MRSDGLEDTYGNFYKELYEMCNNGSIWLIHKASEKLSKFKLMSKTKFGRKIKEYVETISSAVLTDEGGKYALPLMLTIAYFILPIDAVPDMLIPAGLLDDLGVLTTGFILSKKIVSKGNKS